MEANVVTPKQILAEIEARLGRCPKCKTRQFLAEVMVQKKDYGGKFEERNLRKLCMPCDEDWRKFCVSNGFSEKSSFEFEDFEKGFAAFLAASQEELSSKEQALAILKEFATLRVQVAMDVQRHSGRFHSRSKRLDEFYPFAGSYTFKVFSKKGFGEISDEIESNKKSKIPNSWQKFLMTQVADVRALKRALDREIEEQLEYFPVYKLFAEKVPGIGPYLAGYLVAAIKDPKNFLDSSHLSGMAGLRVEKSNGRSVAQSKTRGEKLDYNPLLKLVVVRLIPMCLDKQKNRQAESPYSKLIKAIEEKERGKAENANPDHCWIKNCGEKEMVNLGYEERTVDEETGETKIVFLGFCCKKTLGKPKAHKFLNPAHVLSRVYRDLGRKFLTDFYHTWLYLEGENPDIIKNPRIMHFLQKEE